MLSSKMSIIQSHFRQPRVRIEKWQKLNLIKISLNMQERILQAFMGSKISHRIHGRKAKRLICTKWPYQSKLALEMAPCWIHHKTTGGTSEPLTAKTNIRADQGKDLILMLRPNYFRAEHQALLPQATWVDRTKQASEWRTSIRSTTRKRKRIEVVWIPRDWANAIQFKILQMFNYCTIATTRTASEIVCKPAKSLNQWLGHSTCWCIILELAVGAHRGCLIRKPKWDRVLDRSPSMRMRAPCSCSSWPRAARSKREEPEIASAPRNSAATITWRNWRRSGSIWTSRARQCSSRCMLMASSARFSNHLESPTAPTAPAPNRFVALQLTATWPRSISLRSSYPQLTLMERKHTTAKELVLYPRALFHLPVNHQCTYLRIQCTRLTRNSLKIWT